MLDGWLGLERNDREPSNIALDTQVVAGFPSVANFRSTGFATAQNHYSGGLVGFEEETTGNLHRSQRTAIFIRISHVQSLYTPNANFSSNGNDSIVILLCSYD